MILASFASVMASFGRAMGPTSCLTGYQLTGPWRQSLSLPKQEKRGDPEEGQGGPMAHILPIRTNCTNDPIRGGDDDDTDGRKQSEGRVLRRPEPGRVQGRADRPAGPRKGRRGPCPGGGSEAPGGDRGPDRRRGSEEVPPGKGGNRVGKAEKGTRPVTGHGLRGHPQAIRRQGTPEARQTDPETDREEDRRTGGEPAPSSCEGFGGWGGGTC